MRITMWDILSILGLFALVVMILLFGMIFTNPQSSMNPFPPPTLPALIQLPTMTPTFRSLGPTWTPIPGEGSVPPTLANLVIKATSTLAATATGFVLNTFTPTPTFTGTPTNTPTITKTPAPTSTRTPTRTPNAATLVAGSATAQTKLETAQARATLTAAVRQTKTAAAKATKVCKTLTKQGTPCPP